MYRACLLTFPAKDGSLPTTTTNDHATKRVRTGVLARATMSGMGYLSARLASPRGACTKLTSLLPGSHARSYCGHTEGSRARRNCPLALYVLQAVKAYIGSTMWYVWYGVVALHTYWHYRLCNRSYCCQPLRLFPLWAQTRHWNQASAWRCVLYHAVLAVRVTQIPCYYPDINRCMNTVVWISLGMVVTVQYK